MDRLVWLIVMIVSLNILINSGVHAAGDTDQEPSTSVNLYIYNFFYALIKPN